MVGACSRDNPCGGSTRNVCAPSTIVQRILPHCQHKAFANGFLSKRLCCITLWAQCSNMSGVRLILSLDVSHLSGS